MGYWFHPRMLTRWQPRSRRLLRLRRFAAAWVGKDASCIQKFMISGANQRLSEIFSSVHVDEGITDRYASYLSVVGCRLARGRRRGRARPAWHERHPVAPVLGGGSTGCGGDIPAGRGAAVDPSFLWLSRPVGNHTPPLGAGGYPVLVVAAAIRPAHGRAAYHFDDRSGPRDILHACGPGGYACSGRRRGRLPRAHRVHDHDVPRLRSVLLPVSRHAAPYSVHVGTAQGPPLG